MKLPFAEQALVAEAKLTDYLLSLDHPQGLGKAQWLLGLGFRLEEPDVLRQALLRVAATADMEETTTRFGRKFVGSAEIETPGGRTVRIRTVWMLPDGIPPPHLVTAYPIEPREGHGG